MPRSFSSVSGKGRNREAISSVFRVSRVFRYSSSRRQPPYFPRSATTGIPRALRSFRSRKTVRLDTSSFSANSLVVIFPLCWRRSSRASNRSARMHLSLSFLNKTRDVILRRVLSICPFSADLRRRRHHALGRDRFGSESDRVHRDEPGRVYRPGKRRHRLASGAFPVGSWGLRLLGV